MKKLLVLSITLFSLQSFAGLVERDWQTYSGWNTGFLHNGDACSFRIAFNTNSVNVGEVTFGDKATINDQQLIIEGSTDFIQARATIVLGSDGEPSNLKFETKNPLMPFYTTTLKCTGLVRTK